MQADYALDQVEEVAEINRAAARLAKKATAAYMAAHPGSRKFVAGAIGPTNKTLSVSPSVENPALRGVTYDEIEQAYYEQAKALWEGGVDMFLVETIFDTGNAKAAIYALERFFEEQVGCWAQRAGRCLQVQRCSPAVPAASPALCHSSQTLPLPCHPSAPQRVRIPVFISGTIVDNSGRTLSGQTNEAFWNSVSHAKPMAIGLNCALGATDMKQYIANLSACADCFVFCYPNAGLPNAMGGYDQKGPEMAEEIRPFCECTCRVAGLVCCGAAVRACAMLECMGRPRACPCCCCSHGCCR